MVTHSCHLFDDDDENGMRSTTHVVHLGSCCCPAQSSLLHKAIDLVGRSNCPLTQTFDEDTFFLIFSNLERGPIYL
jgi:hypothetical protein